MAIPFQIDENTPNQSRLEQSHKELLKVCPANDLHSKETFIIYIVGPIFAIQQRNIMN